jgi:hypothetical protein
VFSSFCRDKRVQSTGQLCTGGAVLNLPVHVQSVIFLQLVRSTGDKLELLNWDAEGLEYSFEEEGIVFRSVFEGLEGRFVSV